MQRKSLLSVILCSAVFSANAKIIYVSSDGSNANNGTSWGTSVADIQKAYQISESGDQIWVAGGTYDLSMLTPVESPSCYVEMKDNVNLYGGFKKGDASIDSRETVNNNEPWNFKNQTIITASSYLEKRPFDRSDKDANSSWSSVVDGIKFQGISTSNARIIYASSGTTFNNIWIDGCKADGNNSTFIYLERGGIVNNSLFENCMPGAKPTAGIIQLRGSLPTAANNFDEKGLSMDNCTFRNNSCISLSVYITGGGLLADRSNDVNVTNTQFLNNSALALSANNGGTGRVCLIDNCLFEGNIAPSEVTTNYAASLISIAGENAYLNRATIRNNKNSIAAEEDYKNSLIFINNANVCNTLIANNESNHATVSNTGNMINSTIANNTGIIQMDKMAAMLNCIVYNNESDKVKLMAESSCFLVNSAFAQNALEGTSEMEDGTINLSSSQYKAATSFNGNATNETQIKEIKRADFTLTDNSNCIGKGAIDDFLFGADGLVENIKDAFSKDLAGNNRIDNNKINLGCYQGALASGITTTTAHKISKVYGSKNTIFVESPKAEIRVIGVGGSEIYRATANGGMTEIKIPAKGVVFVVITAEGNTETHKVIL